MFLIPGDDWYLASFPMRDPAEELYIDVTTPAEWGRGEVRLVDLDLDILRSHDGATRLIDEDEFAQHRVSMAYPDHLIDGALAAAGRLLKAATTRQEPFGVAHRRWHAALSAGRPLGPPS